MGKQEFKQQQTRQTIHVTQNVQEHLYDTGRMAEADNILEERHSVPLDMPMETERASLIDNEAPEYEESEKQEEYVAMNGTYQLVNDQVDGHYMKKLKNALNKESAYREEGEGSIPVVDYTVEMISELKDEGQINAIAKSMNSIISTCRMYRFTHPFPISKRAKKRKTEVKAVEQKAKERLEACKSRLKFLDEESKATAATRKKGGGTLDQATSGWNNVWNYVGAGLGFTLGNIWNTIGMVATTALWPIASGIKSIKQGRLTGISIPHPHSFDSWYQTVLRNNMDRIEGNKEDSQQSSGSIEYIYNDLNYKKLKWYNRLVMK